MRAITEISTRATKRVSWHKLWGGIAARSPGIHVPHVVDSRRALGEAFWSGPDAKDTRDGTAGTGHLSTCIPGSLLAAHPLGGEQSSGRFPCSWLGMLDQDGLVAGLAR
jgi:hypothetical protein